MVLGIADSGSGPVQLLFDEDNFFEQGVVDGSDSNSPVDRRHYRKTQSLDHGKGVDSNLPGFSEGKEILNECSCLNVQIGDVCLDSRTI